MAGRIGDSPLIGCGGYANNRGAVSSTGHGESIMKVMLAREVTYNIENGDHPEQACQTALRKMFTLLDGQGGVIAVDCSGKVGKAFTTKRMPWATIAQHTLSYGIEPNEELADEACQETFRQNEFH